VNHFFWRVLHDVDKQSSEELFAKLFVVKFLAELLPEFWVYFLAHNLVCLPCRDKTLPVSFTKPSFVNSARLDLSPCSVIFGA
jgi:hypothetical protein